MNCSIEERIGPRCLDERRGEGWSCGERIAPWEGRASSRINMIRRLKRELRLLESSLLYCDGLAGVHLHICMYCTVRQ